MSICLQDLKTVAALLIFASCRESGIQMTSTLYTNIQFYKLKWTPQFPLRAYLLHFRKGQVRLWIPRMFTFICAFIKTHCRSHCVFI